VQAVIATGLLAVLLFGAPDAATPVPVEIALTLPVEASARVELLLRSEDSSPRWVLSESAIPRPDGTVTLHAAAGRRALVAVRSGATRVYRLEGPFEWPRGSVRRAFRGSARRALAGVDPARADLDFRLVGASDGSDPLCDRDAYGRWRCLGVPAAFAGRLVACAEGRPVGAAEVRPDAGDKVSLREISFAAAFRVESPDRMPLPTRVRILRPFRPDDFLLAPDPSSEFAVLGDGFVWVEATPDAVDRVVELGAPGYAVRRLGVDEFGPPCDGPVRISLTPAVELRGSVLGPDGQPLASATVLARSAEPTEDPRISGDATTDDVGAFAIPDLEPGVYRIRACHGELGCREERGSPGEPVRIVLGGGGAFTGRAVSGAGVPEVDAAVRIVPTADAWAASTDRVGKLPLHTRSGRDGRFRIAAPEPGDFLVEVRGSSGGVARAAVRRTALSPAVTELGDLRLAGPIEFTARVRACGDGWLSFSGPLGGETSLPDLSRFRLDASGSTSVQLSEPGAWAAWAACAGRNEAVRPPMLPDVSGLDGTLVEFERAGDLAGPD
jgi:carboxypeptidase family protein